MLEKKQRSTEPCSPQLSLAQAVRMAVAAFMVHRSETAEESLTLLAAGQVCFIFRVPLWKSYFKPVVSTKRNVTRRIKAQELK